MRIATSGQSQQQRYGDIMGKSSLISHQALGWLYKSDRVAYHLAMATMEAVQPQKGDILNCMTDEQRELARKAFDKDMTWKR
jgi:hypothetical protein